jgi:glycosyltransferase involved in cell wall biosynthesis
VSTGMLVNERVQRADGTATRRRRVLFIAYTFPPIGGAGVQRTTKFVKYLADYGWDASVLTVEGGSVPVWDNSFSGDIPASAIVRRAKTLEPSYATKASADGAPPRGLLSSLTRGGRRMVHSAGRAILQPDAQVLWMPHAWKHGRRLLDETPHDAIIATGPPFSCFLLGTMLARRSGLPLVLDYRDEWDLSNRYYENRQPGWYAEAVQQRMQRWVLRNASAVLATTEASAAALTERMQQAGVSRRAGWIYNGYDPSDFDHVSVAPRNPDAFRLVYTGTLWNLMSVQPLLEAVRRISASAPALAARLEIVIAGRRTDDQEKLLEGFRGLPCRLTTHSYLDHDAALGLMCSADALCLLLADLPGADRWVPAKTFEYMATGRPILAVVPPGELRSLLHNHDATVIGPEDVDTFAAILSDRLAAHVNGRVAAAGERCRSPHSRRVQAGELAQMLERMGGRRLDNQSSPQSADAARLRGVTESSR